MQKDLSSGGKNQEEKKKSFTSIMGVTQIGTHTSKGAGCHLLEQNNSCDMCRPS